MTRRTLNQNRYARLACLLSLVAALSLAGRQCQAGLFKLDFSILQGEADGWDIIDPVMAEEECVYMGNDATPCTIFELTDRSGEQDNDATLEILEFPMLGNNPEHLAEPQVYDGIDVPLEALGDYHYRNPDTAGTSLPFRFSNINPGNYAVTVFEGRTTDGNGQFAKLWVGDADGSNEPGEFGAHEGKNTTDFAAGSSTLSLDIGEGEYLWYRHLEDNSGGISGIIIRQLRGLDLVPGDFNEDGSLDTVDFMILADHFNQDGKFADGDMNFSGHVDLDDFIKFREVYDARPQGIAAVPEPTSGAFTWLLTVGVVSCIRRRRARTTEC